MQNPILNSFRVFLVEAIGSKFIIGGKDCKMAARWVADEEREMI
jgi:hypothetical protein